MAQINHNSFLVFFDSNGEPVMPRPYEYALECNPEVWLVPGESYALYVKGSIPAITSITDGVNSYSVTSSATTISAHTDTDTVLTFEIGSVPEGAYKFVAGSYTSQTVYVSSEANAKKDTVYIEFHQRHSLGTFWYPYTSEGFKNKIRVRIIWVGDEVFTEKKTAVSSPDGNSMRSKYVSPYGRTEAFTRFRVEGFRPYIHRAMSFMTNHENISINGISYFFRSDGTYTPNSNGSYLYDAEFSLTIQDSFMNLKT